METASDKELEEEGAELGVEGVGSLTILGVGEGLGDTPEIKSAVESKIATLEYQTDVLTGS